MKNKTGKPQKIELYVCQGCEQPILPSKGKYPNGFIIHGNIYAAEPNRGGMIGDNFPQPSKKIDAEEEDPKFYADDVGENVFCRTCLAKTLGLSDFEDIDEKVDEADNPKDGSVIENYVIRSRCLKRTGRTLYYIQDEETWGDKKRLATLFTRNRAAKIAEDIECPGPGYASPTAVHYSEE